MAVSAIAAGAPPQTSTFAQTRQAFNQLSSALQSGDLAAAQSAYATLASSPAAQGNSSFAQSLQQIGQSLQSGDIAGAQKSLASLQQAGGTRPHHHHHHGAKPAAVASDPANPTDPTADGSTTSVTSSNTVDISA
jgi:hypothetical protein